MDQFQQNVGISAALRDLESARSAQLNLGSRPQAVYGPGLASGQIGVPTPQQGEIESQIDILSNQLKSIQALVGQASDRFSPILALHGNLVGGVKDLPPLYSQIGNQISLLNSAATQIRSDLQELIDRCKL